MNQSHAARRHRKNAQHFDDLVAQPAFLFGFETGLKQLQAVFPSRLRCPVVNHPVNAIGIRFGSRNMLLLIAQGRFCTMLAQRLLCVRGQRAVGHTLRLATSLLSRQLASHNSSATCAAHLVGHIHTVTSVAFYRSAPLLATGSSDHTAKLWRLSPDNSSATCVATLQGHSNSVQSVAFHPTAPLLATGSWDKTAKLWRLSHDNSSATCVATLQGHRDEINSVAFHPTAPLLATGSYDHSVKLWRLSSDHSSATCVSTLKGHSASSFNPVHSVAFHPTSHLLATGSYDKTAKLWR